MSLLPPAITPAAIGWAVQRSLNHTRLDLGSGRCFAVRIKIRVGGNSLVRWLSLGSYASIGSSKLSAHCPWHDFEQIRQRHLDRDFQTDHGLSSYPLYDRDTLFYTSGIIEVIYPLFFYLRVFPGTSIRQLIWGTIILDILYGIILSSFRYSNAHRSITTGSNGTENTRADALMWTPWVGQMPQ